MNNWLRTNHPTDGWKNRLIASLGATDDFKLRLEEMVGAKCGETKETICLVQICSQISNLHYPLPDQRHHTGLMQITKMGKKEKIVERLKQFCSSSSIHQYPHLLPGGYIRRCSWNIFFLLSSMLFVTSLHRLFLEVRNEPTRVTISTGKHDDFYAIFRC